MFLRRAGQLTFCQDYYQAGTTRSCCEHKGGTRAPVECDVTTEAEAVRVCKIETLDKVTFMNDDGEGQRETDYYT